MVVIMEINREEDNAKVAALYEVMYDLMNVLSMLALIGCSSAPQISTNTLLCIACIGLQTFRPIAMRPTVF